MPCTLQFVHMGGRKLCPLLCSIIHFCQPCLSRQMQPDCKQICEHRYSSHQCVCTNVLRYEPCAMCMLLANMYGHWNHERQAGGPECYRCTATLTCPLAMYLHLPCNALCALHPCRIVRFCQPCLSRQIQPDCKRICEHRYCFCLCLCTNVLRYAPCAMCLLLANMYVRWNTDPHMGP